VPSGTKYSPSACSKYIRLWVTKTSLPVEVSLKVIVSGVPDKTEAEKLGVSGIVYVF
jgi:hypothetical protein